MKKKQILSIVLVLFFSGIISSSVFSQDDELKNIAIENLAEWSKSFSLDQFNQLGYKDKAEFDKSELGSPYQVFTMDPNKLLRIDSLDDFGALLTKTGYTVYPVILDGRNKSLLWMYQKDNEWKTARIGSSGIAENLKVNEEVIDKYREDRGLSDRAVPKLVRIYQLYFDFFYIKGEETAYIIPMQTLPDLNIRGNTFYSVEEILPILKEELKNKMPFKDDEGRIKEY